MKTPVSLAFASLAIAGCSGVVAVDPQGDFPFVARLVKERTGQVIARQEEPRADSTPPAQMRDAIAGGLTVDGAIAVALLSNHELQALYSDLGVAQSDLVQASLLHNPVLDAAAGLPIGGGAVDVSLGVALDVVDVLYVPLRKRVAGAAFEEAKLRVAAEVLDLAWRTETAFYRHQANEQIVETRVRIVEATGASAALAKRMRKAGNVTELAVESERALESAARLELRMAESAARDSRERLNRLMGVSGPDTGWKLASARLPDPPQVVQVGKAAKDAWVPVGADDVESRALERSIDLAISRHALTATAEQVGYTRSGALFPEVLVGGRADRARGEWHPGPSLLAALPLFDWGQARRARAEAELRRAQHSLSAVEVAVRTAARSARDRVRGEQERALFYKNVDLPLRTRIVKQTGLHYNAMQLGPLELLRAKQQQIEAALGYVESLRDYWLARADLALLLAGRLPPSEAAPPIPAIDSPRRSPIPTLG